MLSEILFDMFSSFTQVRSFGGRRKAAIGSLLVAFLLLGVWLQRTTADGLKNPSSTGERTLGSPDSIHKVWSAQPVIIGGQIVQPSAGTVLVEQGHEIHLEVAEATDQDTWTLNGRTGTESDEIKYQWQATLQGVAGGSFTSSTTRSTMWTAPMLSNVAPNIDSVSYSLTCTIDDTPKAIAPNETGTRGDAAINRSINVTVFRKFWSPGQGIQGGILASSANVSISPNTSVSVSVTNATDSDSWVKGLENGSDLDDITYSWTSDNGGFFVGANTPNATWTPPALPEGTDTATYHLICRTDDTPKLPAADEGGSRNDSPIDQSVTVKVTRPHWSPMDKEIGFHPKLDDEGNIIKPYVWLPDGRITAPVDYRQETIPEKIVTAGEQVTCSVEEAQDWDTYTDKDGFTISKDLPLTYTWSANIGKFRVEQPDGTFVLQDSATGNTVIWVAPVDLTEITTAQVKCTLDDPAGDRVLALESGSHDDQPMVRQTQIKVLVPQKNWDPGTGITGTIAGIAAGSNVEPGAILDLSITASDVDHWAKVNGESGNAADEINYSWSANGGEITELSGALTATWKVPLEPGEYTVTVLVDDEGTIYSPEMGTRDDEEKIVELSVVVPDKTWTTGLPLCVDKQGEATIENGRLIAPQDQRGAQANWVAVSTKVKKVVQLEVEEATDWDHWTYSNGSGDEKDQISYFWQCSNGEFLDDVTLPNPRWKAPEQPGSVTITCTIDDSYDELGTGESPNARDDSPAVVRTLNIDVQDAMPVEWSGEVTSSGELRACAGGIDDRLETDHQYRAHTRQVTMTYKEGGQAVSGATFKLRFKNNKGHDYSEDPDMTRRTSERLYATLFNPTAVSEGDKWQIERTVTTDANGQVSVWVKSSDVVCHPSLEAYRVENGQETLKGDLGCEFAESIAFRHFDNPFDLEEEEDLGWIFDFPHLIDPVNHARVTPAKVYLKFKKDRDRGDDYVDQAGKGNWNFVNNHPMRIHVAGVRLHGDPDANTSPNDLEVFDTPQNLGNYAVIKSDLQNSDTSVTVDRTTSGPGETPQVFVKAGEDIDQVETLWIDADDLKIQESE